MALDLFVGIPVTSYAAVSEWYKRFLGGEPISLMPDDVGAVWEVALHRIVCVVQDPERAGNALVTLFVDDLDDRVATLARGGIEPVKRETYDGGVTKVTYWDLDANEICLGHVPI